MRLFALQETVKSPVNTLFAQACRNNKGESHTLG